MKASTIEVGELVSTLSETGEMPADVWSKMFAVEDEARISPVSS